jgi:hypothetical protein
MYAAGVGTEGCPVHSSCMHAAVRSLCVSSATLLVYKSSVACQCLSLLLGALVERRDPDISI